MNLSMQLDFTAISSWLFKDRRSCTAVILEKLFVSSLRDFVKSFTAEQGVSSTQPSPSRAQKASEMPSELFESKGVILGLTGSDHCMMHSILSHLKHMKGKSSKPPLDGPSSHYLLRQFQNTTFDL